MGDQLAKCYIKLSNYYYYFLFCEALVPEPFQKCQSVSVCMCGPHTCVLCPGLSRGWAGLSEANGIASHHPELVLHPCIQAHHCSSEHVPCDHLRH